MPRAKASVRSVKQESNLLERLVPVLLLVSIGLAFVVGMLWQKVTTLEGGGATTLSSGTQSTGTTATSPPSAPATNGKLSDEQVSKIVAVSAEDHIRGSQDAKVFLIEYSDFECPFCQRFHPTAQQVVDEYGGDVAWVYRHFPLDQIHPKARPAAEASECVAELGGEDAFWAFTDEIFKDQTTKLSDLAKTASSVGVNQGAFNSCFESGKYADKVEDHYQGGLATGITGTPGNIILNQNGEAWLIPGALPYEQIKPTIDEALGG